LRKKEDKLTVETFCVFRKAFIHYDRDLNGWTDKAELAMLLEDIGQDNSEESVKTMMEELDKNEDGKIHFNEWILWLANLRAESDNK